MHHLHPHPLNICPWPRGKKTATGNFQKVTKSLIDKLPHSNDRRTFMLQQYAFHVLVKDQIVFLAMVCCLCLLDLHVCVYEMCVRKWAIYNWYTYRYVRTHLHPPTHMQLYIMSFCLFLCISLVISYTRSLVCLEHACMHTISRAANALACSWWSLSSPLFILPFSLSVVSFLSLSPAIQSLFQGVCLQTDKLTIQF